MPHRKRRRSSSSSTSSTSSTSSSSSSSECAGRYRRSKHKRRKTSSTKKGHVSTRSNTPPTCSKVVDKRQKHPPEQVLVDVHNTSDLVSQNISRTERPGRLTHGRDVEATHSRDAIRSRNRENRDKIEMLPNVNVTESQRSEVYVSNERDQQQRIQQLEDLVDQLLQSENRCSVRVSIKPDCIPEFSPGNHSESIKKWLDKIDQLSQINRWDEKTTVYHMQSRLTGLAKTWYNNLDNYKYTWDEWKQLLIEAFPDHYDFPTAIRKLLRRTKTHDESWTEYYFAKMQLLRQCDISGKNAVAMIIDGIHDNAIQSGAKVGRYTTPEELYRDYLSTLAIAQERPRYDSLKKHEKRQLEKPIAPEERRIVKRGKCYNCKQYGHFQTECTKPRIECGTCKKLGHTTDKCFRNKSQKTLLCDLQAPSENSGYYVTCSINGYETQGFIDSGCEEILMRESDARNIGIEWSNVDICLNGYGGATSKVLGSANVDIKVDLLQAELPILIVPDHLQSMPVLIGRSILNKKGAITVMRDGNARIFNAELAELPQLEQLPPKKIILRAKETINIPPNHIGVVNCSTSDNYVGDIIVDFRYSFEPTKESILPRCVTSAPDARIPILNMSESTMWFIQNKVVARGTPCIEDDIQVNVNKININKLTKFSMDDLNGCLTGNISDSEKNKLLLLLNKYRDCFAQNIYELRAIKNVEMSIHLNDNKPVTYRPYRLSLHEREKVRDMVNDMLNAGIVRESQSPYSSPIVLVKKKNGETRMCVDYRSLNAKTIRDCFPLPRVDDHLEILKGCNYFTTLDMASGYHQIKMAEDSIQKTAFVTPDGQYEYLRMPFGLVNAPAMFQRTINQILGSMRFSTALAYMDDILVPSMSFESGLIALADVFEKFRNAGVTLRLGKCQFFKNQIDYLGHEISSSGVRPGTTKIKAVEHFPTPNNVHQVRQFVGLCSYFRKYVKDFAQVARPLTSLTKKDVSFEWGATQSKAFEELKRRLIERPILAIYNPKLDTELHTDASKLGLGGILLQKQENNKLKPVMFYSRQTTKEEQRYHSYELETLAIVNSLRRFRVYLLGLQFKVVTDCNALRTAMTKRDLIPRIGRWWLITQEFSFSVEYRPGTKMAHVDALSRNPVDDPQETQEIDILQVDITNDDWVLATQLTDDRCKHLIEVLSRKPQDAEERQIHKDFEVKNHKLYAKTSDGIKWYVPKAARRVVTMYHHDNMGHFSIEKTLKNIRSNYWFPRMKKYVSRYISACLQCAYNKVPSGKKEGFLHPIPKATIPMDTVHVDHLGPFVKSTKGNAYLIMAIDAFTKFLFVKPVRSTQARPVKDFLENVFQTFGVPRRIICDRGSCFTSETFTAFTKELGIKVVLNATATPRANGQIERYNRTILTAISTTYENERKWDSTISSVVFSINSSVNKATGKSPYELLFGYKPRGLHEAFLSGAVSEDKRENDIQKTRCEAGKRIQALQDKQKAYFDKSRKKCQEYKVGDLVVLRRANLANDGRSTKLLPKYSGPYIVKEVLERDRYVVEDLPGSKRAQKKYRGVCSVDRMKPFTAAYESSSNDSDTNAENENLV